MNNKIKNTLTQIGKEELEKELNYLKNVKRKENIEALKEARAQGDLSENADYDAARDEQARIESRIKEIEDILKTALVVVDGKDGYSLLGKSIVIKYLTKDGKDMKNTKEETIKLVGTYEADPLNNNISLSSPIGVALSESNVEDGSIIEFESGSKIKYRVKVLSIKK